MSQQELIEAYDALTIDEGITHANAVLVLAKALDVTKQQVEDMLGRIAMTMI